MQDFRSLTLGETKGKTVAFIFSNPKTGQLDLPKITTLFRALEYQQFGKVVIIPTGMLNLSLMQSDPGDQLHKMQAAFDLTVNFLKMILPLLLKLPIPFEILSFESVKYWGFSDPLFTLDSKKSFEEKLSTTENELNVWAKRVKDQMGNKQIMSPGPEFERALAEVEKWYSENRHQLRADIDSAAKRNKNGVEGIREEDGRTYIKDECAFNYVLSELNKYELERSQKKRLDFLWYAGGLLNRPLMTTEIHMIPDQNRLTLIGYNESSADLKVIPLRKDASAGVVKVRALAMHALTGKKSYSQLSSPGSDKSDLDSAGSSSSNSVLGSPGSGLTSPATPSSGRILTSPVLIKQSPIIVRNQIVAVESWTEKTTVVPAIKTSGLTRQPSGGKPLRGSTSEVGMAARYISGKGSPTVNERAKDADMVDLRNQETKAGEKPTMRRVRKAASISVPKFFPSPLNKKSSLEERLAACIEDRDRTFGTSNKARLEKSKETSEQRQSAAGIVEEVGNSNIPLDDLRQNDKSREESSLAPSSSALQVVIAPTKTMGPLTREVQASAQRYLDSVTAALLKLEEAPPVPVKIKMAAAVDKQTKLKMTLEQMPSPTLSVDSQPNSPTSVQQGPRK